MLRKIMLVFLNGLTARLSREEKVQRLIKLTNDLLQLPQAELFTWTEVDRLHQLLILRGGTEPEVNLTIAALDAAERLQSLCLHPNSCEMLIVFRISLLGGCGDEEEVLRLVDLLECLLALPEATAPNIPIKNYQKRLIARSLNNYGEHDLTHTVLSLANQMYFNSLRSAA